jgi:RIO kinase 1
LRDSAYRRRGTRRFDDDDDSYEDKRYRHRMHRPQADTRDRADGLGAGERWSTWEQSSPTERGPRPYPAWLVTESAATDTELGILKTGKEADVFLLGRGVPGTDRFCLLAAKRYRSAEHRMFHRDIEYLAGRRFRESRDTRAMLNRTAVGREMLARHWAVSEFAAFRRLHLAGVPVPYPVQILGTEILLEFIGEPDGTAAPRLADLRPARHELADLWRQLVDTLVTMASLGLTHGDLSAYNLLVHRGRLVVIDLPQVIDVIAHPRGKEFLDRDAGNVARWFAAHGLDIATAGPDVADLAAVLRHEARLR